MRTQKDWGQEMEELPHELETKTQTGQPHCYDDRVWGLGF